MPGHDEGTGEVDVVHENGDVHNVGLQYIFVKKMQILTGRGQSIQDFALEDELVRNPYWVQNWIRYINRREAATFDERCELYERALKNVPGSYKIWKRYLEFRLEHVKDANLVKDHEAYTAANDCFERAMILLHKVSDVGTVKGRPVFYTFANLYIYVKMPRLWIMYCQFLTRQFCITQTRRTFDRALRALPVTQHQRIWDIYLPFGQKIGGETAICLYRRFLQVSRRRSLFLLLYKLLLTQLWQLEPGNVEEYIAYIEQMERYDEAVVRLADAVNNEHFRSIHGKSHYQLWMDLCNLIVKHPKHIKSVRVEPIIRTGIKRFSDQVGRLWNTLARYWILLGNFEKARDVYEESLACVMTVRDFTQVFDAYAEFEESVITHMMQRAGRDETNKDFDLMLDLRITRFENLMDRRPFLVNDVFLRQNPNSVADWQARVGACGDDSDKVGESVLSISLFSRV